MNGMQHICCWYRILVGIPRTNKNQHGFGQICNQRHTAVKFANSSPQPDIRLQSPPFSFPANPTSNHAPFLPKTWRVAALVPSRSKSETCYLTPTENSRRTLISLSSPPLLHTVFSDQVSTKISIASRRCYVDPLFRRHASPQAEYIRSARFIGYALLDVVQADRDIRPWVH